MRIAILSTNKSLYSTRRLLEEIHHKGYEGVVIDHSKCFLVVEGNKPTLIYDQQEIDHIDAVIPRIGTSISGFGCAVVRQFEMMKVFTTVKSQAIMRCRDKLRSLQILSKSGVKIPKTVMAKDSSQVEQLLERVGGPPVIIKTLEGTQGVGVVLAETKKAAKSTIEAFYGLRANFLLQEYIAEAGSADIRVFVVGNKVVAAIKRQGLEADFRANLHRGGSGTPVILSEEEEYTALAAAKALGVKVAGVDMLQSSRGPLVIEVNSSPGLQGIEEVTGVNVANKIISYIEEQIVFDESDTVGV